MDDNFSPRVKDVISFSKEEALKTRARLHWNRAFDVGYHTRWWR